MKSENRCNVILYKTEQKRIYINKIHIYKHDATWLKWRIAELVQKYAHHYGEMLS